MENQVLNIRGNLYMPFLDVEKFTPEGVIIYVEGNIIEKLPQDEKHKDEEIYFRHSRIDQDKFIPIKRIVTFSKQGK